MDALNQQYAAWRAAKFERIDRATMPDLYAFAEAIHSHNPTTVSAAITQYACYPKDFEYVLGFGFTPSWRVALVRKARPAWQAGKLNGIGGAIEPGEGFSSAMRREFREETDIDHDDWRLAGLMYGKTWRVYVLTAISEAFQMVRTTTDEKVTLEPVGSVKTSYAVPDLLDNVPALVTLCSLQAGEPSGSIPFFTLQY